MFKNSSIKRVSAFLLLLVMILSLSSVFALADDDDDDIYNDYSKEAMNTPTGNGIVWGSAAYNSVDVNSVTIRDNPLPTTQTTYPGEFPKGLLDLPPLSDEEIQVIIDAVLPVMTFEEKVRILGLSNSDPDGRDGVGWLVGAPRLGIPEIRFNDGPAGISMTKSYRETTNPPNEQLQSATWDPKYAYKIGQIYGMEHKSIGLGYQLGTQYDLIRMPIWARAKDTFGEDYYLAAVMAAGMTKGVQENGGLAMGKHIGAYASDGDTQLWVEVDEQTLHQAYLFPFEYAAKNAQLASIMATYNRLNGFYTSSNYYMQVETMRNMWNWKGAIVPDWGGNREFSMMLGTDISQDNYANLRTNILRAVGYGNLTWRRVDNAVEHSLYALGVGGFLNLVEIDEATGLAKEDPGRSSSDNNSRIKFTDTYTADRAAGLLDQTNAFALEVAEKGIVMLKNDNNALPADKGTIALVGMGAEKLYGGTGGERSFGVLQYMENPKDVFTRELGADKVTSAITVNPYGVAVPASAFFQDAEGTIPGLLRNDGTVDEKIEFLYEKGQFTGGKAFQSGNRTWTGYIKIPADINSFVAQSNGGTLSYNIQAQTNAGGNYTISGNRGGGVAWDEYTPEGLNYTANNISTRNVAPGIYPITVTQTANDSYRWNGIRLAWITESQKAADLEAARVAAATNDTTIFFVQSGRTGHSPVPVTDFNMLKLPDGSYTNASGNTNFVAIIKELADISHANGNKFVLVVFSPTAFAFDGGWLDSVDALISAYYPGQSYAKALLNILTGKVNPSGKTSATYPKTINDTLLTYSNDIKRVRAGAQVQSGEYTAKYTEGLEFGYRWYDSAEAASVGAQYQYPFGYGLSYTTFAYSNLSNSFVPETNELVVSFDITNTGARMGTEIAQVYIGPANLPSGKSYVQQAVKQLVGFKRVEDIAPGETVSVSITVEERMLSYWDIKIPDNRLVRARDGSYGKWLVAYSPRDIMVGGSSDNLPLVGVADIDYQTTAGISAPFNYNSGSLSYTVSLKNEFIGTNQISIAAQFDAGALDFTGSEIVIPGASLMFEDYDAATGAYSARIIVPQQGALFSAPVAKDILKVKFEIAGPGADIAAALTKVTVTEVMSSVQAETVVCLLDPAGALTYFAPYDMNGDGIVTLEDVSLIIYNFYGAIAGDSKWAGAQRFDVNGDGVIDIFDLMIIMTYIA